MNDWRLEGFDLDAFVRATLDEDLGVGLPGGGHDVTAESVIPAHARFSGVMDSRDAIVVAGLPIAAAFFRALDPAMKLPRWLRMPAVAVRQAVDRLSLGLAPVDLEANDPAIAVISDLSVRREALQTERKAIEQTIKDKESFASRGEIQRLQRELATTTGRIEASRAADTATWWRTFVSEEELSIRLYAAVAAAMRLRPAFDAVGDQAARDAARKQTGNPPSPDPQGH